MGMIRKRGCDERGQMAVELCVVFPVAIIIALITVNALLFFSSCAQFDRVSRNAVRIYGTSPEYGEGTEQVIEKILGTIRSAMDADDSEVSVTCAHTYGGYTTYEMRLEYAPTLFGAGMVQSVFGVSLPKLEHVIHLTVDPYKPGMFF